MRPKIVVFFLLYGLASGGVRAMDDLGGLRWESRIILVDESGAEALSTLRAKKAEIDERHLVWFVKSDGRIETNYAGELSQALIDDLNANWFARYPDKAILIGKDGGIKSRDDGLDLQDYFDQIDAMPMRRREMRGGGRSK